MKKRTFLLICLLLTLLCACAVADVAINETNFPDASFRGYVLMVIDTDGNKKLSADEIAETTHIECEEASIKNLKGIEFFTSLESLSCMDNRLSKLDLSSNTKLISLWCGGNKLTSLNVSRCTNLTDIWCEGNQLASLDVSKNTKLKELNCGENKLTSLNVSQNTALKTLSCYTNQLTALNISKNTALTTIICHDNKLTELDVHNNTKLTHLICSNNPLKKLNISSNTKLKHLSCDNNQLSSLDISKNTALVELNCSFNKLSKLNVSKHAALTSLYCDGNKLTTLNVSKNAKLKQLSCYGNKLTKLNVSKNTKLECLICYSNKIPKLDVSNCSALCKLVQKNKRIQLRDYDVFGEPGDLLVDKKTTVVAGKYISKPDNTNTAIVDNLKYKLDTVKETAFLIGPKGKKASSIVIPATITVSGKTYKVTEIATGAFRNLTNLTKVTIGKNVMTIEDHAFSGCEKLKTISIKSEKLKRDNIGYACFEDIYPKATFKCPNELKKKYKSWLVNIGLAPKTVKFK